MRVFRRVTSGAFKYKSASSRARATALPFGTTSATTPHSCAVRAGSGRGLSRNASARPGPITPSGEDPVTRRNAHGEMANVLECCTVGRHDDAGEERVVGMDMGGSLDGRDHRNADIRDVLQGLAAFIVNSAPDARVGDVSERCPFYVADETPTR